jgi:hypothetical protein
MPTRLLVMPAGGGFRLVVQANGRGGRRYDVAGLHGSAGSQQSEQARWRCRFCGRLRRGSRNLAGVVLAMVVLRVAMREGG